MGEARTACYVVNEVTDRARKAGRRKYLNFLDTEKAYDRIDRKMLCKLLEKIGVSEKLVRFISSM